MFTSFSFDKQSKQYQFLLHLLSVEEGRYVALGISKDGSMGDDLVIYCDTTTGNHVKTGWNKGKEPTSPGIKFSTSFDPNLKPTSQIDGVSETTKNRKYIFPKCLAHFA